MRFFSYTKEPISVLGCVEVKISYHNQTANLPLLVMEGRGPSLFGRNWLKEITLNWKFIHQIAINELEVLLSKYKDVFREEFGTLKGFQAHIELVPNAGRHIESLVEEGTLEPVEFSNWAAPIIPLLKSDKSSVRICGDFRITVNPVSKLDRYPIPRIEDLFANLKKGKSFTTLDLSQAYQQLTLDEESRKCVVINTHKGLFKYTRLPYGISSAPGIFQRVMDNLLQGLSGVAVYLDNILVTGATEEEHLRTLGKVLGQLETSGLCVKKKKCQFMVPNVTYLGHQIDASGLHPLPDKVRAIEEAPAPNNVTELKSYLGLLTYYGKFLPNLAIQGHPCISCCRNNVLGCGDSNRRSHFKPQRNCLHCHGYWYTSTQIWN